MDGDKLEPSTAERPQPISLVGLHLEDDGFDARYNIRRLLGEGGMSEVYGCADLRVGRDVAMKVLDAAVGARGQNLERFLREARVQGQLEHPAIVPVYDLGRSPYGATFFTMRRVRGLTLTDILKGVRDEDPVLTARFTRRRLLQGFANVCLAIEYAHERGVLHCDLKPSNLMFGEYGEVYVVDWGLARVATEAGPPDEAPETGRVIGTPGYMAPEQVRALARDGRADVYALGAILFEILTLQPLHPRTSTREALRSTLKGADARRASLCRERQVPPELDTACARATRVNPDERTQTVRELYEAVDRFLEGDRDSELRARLASSHAEEAERAAERAIAASDPAQAIDERRAALREAHRALAFDPQSRVARGVVRRLLLEPMRGLPEDLRREFQAHGEGMNRTSAATGALAYLGVLLVAPLTLWMGVRSTVQALVVLALVALSITVLVAAGRLRTRRVVGTYAALTTSTVTIASLSLIAGPLIVIPAMAAVNTLGYVMQLPPRHRPWITLIGCLGVLVPVALERLEVLPPAYAFRDGTLAVLPRMHHLPEGPTTLFLVLASVGLILAAAFYGGRLRDARAEAELRLQVYAWHLRQFLDVEEPRASKDARR